MNNFFRKIFTKKKKPVLDVKTAPLSDEQLLTVSIQRETYKPLQYIFGCGQSVGIQRDHNEDCLLAFGGTLSGGDDEVPFGVFIVADGMGGHQHGEIASNVAARTMAEYLFMKIYPSLLGIQGSPISEPIQETMDNGVREAHLAVVRKAPGGGTTLTAALVIGEQVTLAHVGDSRAYFIYPDGRTQIMTQDHSVVRRLVELGQMSEKDAAASTQRNVLYRALGQPDPFKPDIANYLMPHPGYLLLCSDGLWGVVPDPEIFRIVAASPNPAKACNQLVEAANSAGGPDNISVVLIQYLS